MLNTHPEIFPATIVTQRCLQPAACVFHEHQVFAIQARKFLFVLSLHRTLYRCL